jgi:hypothetical protein
MKFIAHSNNRALAVLAYLVLAVAVVQPSARAENAPNIAYRTIAICRHKMNKPS